MVDNPFQDIKFQSWSKDLSQQFTGMAGDEGYVIAE